MLPVIAIVGRPNVGKSTLFNRLTKSRRALVANESGLTRDRQYGEGVLGPYPYIVVDTGGIGESTDGVVGVLEEQSKLAIVEADLIVFLVDGRAGLTAADEAIADHLRRCPQPVHCAVNKIDGVDPDIACSDFHALGFGQPFAIAAAHGRGVTQMIESILPEPQIEETEEPEKDGIQLAIVGRPNVGKSTLVNRILGEERMVVYDMPGTTRDSIDVPMERHGVRYTLIDTAGVRRRARVKGGIEKFSVIKTLQTIERANVILVLLDAREGVTEQDLHLLGFVLDTGKALVIAVNKWDGLSLEQKDKVKRDLDRRLHFVDFARQKFISALHGTGVGDLFPLVQEAYQSAFCDLPTPKLNEILAAAITQHPPPMVRNRRVKLRYAHAGGHNPPRIIIHGNQTESISHSYQRYLSNTFRQALKLMGTPIQLEFKTSDNPYKDRRNRLTPRQERKRKRLFRHTRKSKH